MDDAERNAVVNYATPRTVIARPTRHSGLAGWACGVLVLETMFRGIVTFIAHRRSPTYPWARFSRNVGNPNLFIRMDQVLLLLGAGLAVIALFHPYRKRWAALAALAAHLFVLFYKYDVLRLVRY